MNLNPTAYAFIGLTALVAGLMGILVFAVLRFGAAARDARKSLGENRSETAFMTTALHEAVTKLKAQEREMSARAEASERLSDEIVQSLTAGLVVVTSENAVRIMNPASRRTLGLDETAVGNNYRDVLKQFEPLADAIGECLVTGEPIVRRHLKISSSGPVTHLGVSVSALTDGHGQPHGVICLFSDLTPVMEMEEQLRLKDSLARVGELTAGIAHEFRNGLATIHGYARLLDLNALPATYRPHVEGIRQETDALGQVVTNFLNFARPTHITTGPVPLQAIVERAAEEGREMLNGSGSSVVTLKGDFPVVDGDDVLLRQAFSNLVRNAIEAATEAQRAPEVVIEGVVLGDHVRVSVNDNGPGIPAAERERIFMPFVTSKGHGTGLGLALVQKIVVTHNGRIQVGGSSLGGASFQVTLPVKVKTAVNSVS